MIEACPGTDKVPAHKAFAARVGVYVECQSCRQVVATTPWSAETPQDARIVKHYRFVTRKEAPVPKPSPLDVAALADRVFKVVKEAADMVNSFIETEVIPAAEEAKKAAAGSGSAIIDQIAKEEEAERARKFRVASSTGISGIRMPQNGMKDPFANTGGQIVPQEPQPPCGATVVMRRVEGTASETVFCMRADGPCPYGPHVDVHGTEGAGYCAATGRRGRVETDNAF